MIDEQYFRKIGRGMGWVEAGKLLNELWSHFFIKLVIAFKAFNLSWRQGGKAGWAKSLGGTFTEHDGKAVAAGDFLHAKDKIDFRTEKSRFGLQVKSPERDFGQMYNHAELRAVLKLNSP